ncbi:YdeI/OmpD-associated family protein [Paenibacillus arenilitoris]|uniref:DUF1905 domain-containing protein n=1 Tax=Paenibacillus arenilitoris TaxID=2772299 RepID=A0A927CU90_9BACL|nr:YdeI/OmpD-associated family protein [Paenibacillus arenilitoris]MBD2872331.1 DUF1905 domain-containing protein [Paenibacillus arenilitoris]
MTEQKFEAVLVRPEAVGAWTYMTVPFDAEKLFGSKARIAVKGTINGVSYKGTLMPNGNGEHFMVVNQAIRDAIGAEAGDRVTVTMERDEEARIVRVPDDFAGQLAGHPKAEAAFHKFSYSCQKEYVDWIESAKKAETRQSRIQKAIEKLTLEQKLK